MLEWFFWIYLIAATIAQAALILKGICGRLDDKLAAVLKDWKIFPCIPKLKYQPLLILMILFFTVVGLYDRAFYINDMHWKAQFFVFFFAIPYVILTMRIAGYTSIRRRPLQYNGGMQLQYGAGVNRASVNDNVIRLMPNQGTQNSMQAQQWVQGQQPAMQNPMQPGVPHYTSIQ